jgi:hypothetical protein
MDSTVQQIDETLFLKKVKKKNWKVIGSPARVPHTFDRSAANSRWTVGDQLNFAIQQSVLNIPSFDGTSAFRVS